MDRGGYLKVWLTVLVGALALGCGDLSLVSATSSRVETARTPGCGIVFGPSSNPIMLGSLSQADISGDATSKLPTSSDNSHSRESHIIVGPIAIVDPIAGVGDAICAIPVSTIRSEVYIKDAIQSAVDDGRVARHSLPEDARMNGDWQMEALFIEEFKHAESTGLTLVRRSYKSAIPRVPTASFLNDDAALYGPHQLSTITITASPINHNWFFDFRNIIGIWYGTHSPNLSFDGTIVWFAGPSPCQTASDDWLMLDQLERKIDDMIAALSGVDESAAAFAAQYQCPDSLMAPGQNCLDFYIQAETALLGLLEGDSRTLPMPYASLAHSKVFVIDDFNNDRVKILVAGSTINIPWITWPSGSDRPSVFTKQHSFPALPSQMIERLDIDMSDPNIRILRISISNAVCPWVQMGLYIAGYPSASALLDGACLNIDAEVKYERYLDHWRVTNITRDAFPSLDVFYKDANGTLNLIDRTTEKHWTFLTGLLKIKSKIQQAKYEVLNQQGCDLQ